MTTVTLGPEDGASGVSGEGWGSAGFISGPPGRSGPVSPLLAAGSGDRWGLGRSTLPGWSIAGARSAGRAGDTIRSAAAQVVDQQDRRAGQFPISVPQDDAVRKTSSCRRMA